MVENYSEAGYQSRKEKTTNRRANVLILMEPRMAQLFLLDIEIINRYFLGYPNSDIYSECWEDSIEFRLSPLEV